MWKFGSMLGRNGAYMDAKEQSDSIIEVPQILRLYQTYQDLGGF